MKIGVWKRTVITPAGRHPVHQGCQVVPEVTGGGKRLALVHHAEGDLEEFHLPAGPEIHGLERMAHPVPKPGVSG